MKKTPLSRGKSVLNRQNAILRSRGFQAPRKPINKKSERQVEYDAEFAAIRPAILDRDKHRCQGRSFVCQRVATHVHHIKTRSAGGDNSPSNLVSLCSRCHDFIHSVDPAWAESVGLLITK